MSALLPLFPLDLVLLPGAVLPLHIFEPRYKEMISECVEQKKHFGVLRVKSEGIADIGCTAEVVSVSKTYPDGRMDIVTEGRDRFELVQVDQARSFLRGEVLFLQDGPDEATPEEAAHAVGLRDEIIALAGEAPGATTARPVPLSFQLAALPLDLDFKQALLSTKSEAERIRSVIAYFESALPTLRRAVHVRQSAGGNGHVH